MELITSNIKSKDHYICDNDDHDDHVGGDYDDMFLYLNTSSHKKNEKLAKDLGIVG